jgi:sortase A
VGERGNYALAAHRVTHGEPFADFPQLQAGDLVHIETVDADYTYELDTGGMDLIVPFTESWVLDAFPVNPDAGETTAPGKPGDRLITLLTCSEIFHTDNRMIAFGHLVKSEKKAPVTKPAKAKKKSAG